MMSVYQRRYNISLDKVVTRGLCLSILKANVCSTFMAAFPTSLFFYIFDHLSPPSLYVYRFPEDLVFDV
jgi:hypothetical protein